MGVWLTCLLGALAGPMLATPIHAAPMTGLPTVDGRPPPVRPTLAVLGDSDSHAFHDRIALGSGTPSARGGALHATTFQWTEILDRLRGAQIDQGPFEAVGQRALRAWVNRRLTRRVVRQRKEDFRFNLAYTGAECAGLLDPGFGQARVLADLMAADPARWKSPSAVLIRIGINDLGRSEQLEQFARTGLDSEARARVNACADAVAGAVTLLKSRHPGLAVLIVGILDNADWPRLHARWHDPQALAGIAAVLDAYDDRLRSIADATDRGWFLDDRALARRMFGGRGPDGRPAYLGVSVGGTVTLTMTEGDEPNHAVLADGHAGTLWNGRWAAALVDLLNRALDLSIPAISDAEILNLADPRGRHGLHP